MSSDPEHAPNARLSRRGLLMGAAAGGAGLAMTGPAGAASTMGTADGKAMHSPSVVGDHGLQYDFYGKGPQAGIMTPPQRYVFFMTFDLTSSVPRDLQVLLARWSAAIAQMTKGETIGQVEPSRPNAAGFDTGEALGLGSAGLTVTVGMGPGVFSEARGLQDHRPPLLRPLKHLPSDALKPELTGGDLSLQACADDPQVAYHAVRDLARIAKDTGAAATRWTVMGFGRASAGKDQQTPRNLLGFKDGTRNVRGAEAFDRHVWVQGGADWQRHGTYQVVRKIQMHIENWDTDRISDQNAVFGRHKLSGAPLTGTQEFDTPDFARRGPDGAPVIPATAHIRLAAHENNGGVQILRRPFNYTDGINQFGLLDAGLLFISYQSDPAHFEMLQTKLGEADALNEYISHIGSGLFFVPPAPEEGSYIGEAMFRSA
ncbi:Dyp-type peroxidase [Acidimangrovimonas sediminis]|uniref:Dyp-type peroxidase n=1 Tax=Acidimangrovimonas sediminis TaxID=2056283 RepID=UPI000C7F8181|nr:Dyp-type peroxidase [Acidimangrovimonas sediminis]